MEPKQHYAFVYKCRLCGETESNPHMTAGRTAVILKLADSISRMKAVPEVKLFDIHSCKDGSAGISDLQGVIVCKE